MKVKNGIALVALTIGLVSMLCCGYTTYRVRANEKIAFVELQKVFDEFEMTKEYKSKLETVVLARKNITDSLGLDLTARSKALKQTQSPDQNKVQGFLYDKEYYQEKVKQMDEDNLALKRKYDSEINSQLNQYVKDYGQKNGYRFIYGAEGSGVLMYARETDNISEQVISYINERYKGKSK